MSKKRLGIVWASNDKYDDDFWTVRYGEKDTDILIMSEDQFAGSLFPIDIGNKVELAYSRKSSHVGEWVAITRNDEDLDKEYS